MKTREQPLALTWLVSSLLLAGCGGQAASPSSIAPTSPVPSASVVRSPAASAALPSAAASAGAGSAAPRAGAGKAIKLGFSQSAVPFTPFYVAKDAGIFAKHGLNVTLQQVNGPAAIPALLADEVQFDGLGANELTRAAVAGAPVTALATLGDLPVFLLMADKKYKSVEDLAGQTIGVTSLGSSTEVTARLFLEHFKMQDKVKIAPAGGTSATVYAALAQGVVQAAIMSPEQGARATKEGGFVELVDGLKLGVRLNFSVLAVKRSYAKDNADVVKNFVAAYQEAWNYAGDSANKTTVLNITSKYIKSTPEQAKPGYVPWASVWSAKKVPTVDPEGIANILRFADDPKVKSAKPEEFIDDSFLKSIQP